MIPETPPLAEELTAPGEGESIFLGVRSLVGFHIPSGWPHTNACGSSIVGIWRKEEEGEGKKEGRRRKINMKLGRGHEVGGGILRDLEMGSGHGSGQNAKSSKDKLKIF